MESEYAKYARTLECPQCGKQFVGAAAIERHLVAAHEIGPATAHDIAGQMAIDAVPAHERSGY